MRRNPEPDQAEPQYPALDLYVYVSGGVWQHERRGVKLGTLTERGRDSLRVMMYLPDELMTRDEAAAWLGDAFADAADKVRERLNRRRPEWPIDRLVAELVRLSP